MHGKGDGVGLSWCCCRVRKDVAGSLGLYERGTLWDGFRFG